LYWRAFSIVQRVAKMFFGSTKKKRLNKLVSF
jgi:hypothetical protein